MLKERKYPGYFIVIEGIDGAGTTTQASLLKERLLKQGLKVELTSEPTKGAIGRIIREFLKPSDKFKLPDWVTMALLFSADRRVHSEREIIPKLKQGYIVISDRYYHSTLAYQSVSLEDKDALKWLISLNTYAIVPDITFILDLSCQEASLRLGKKRKKEIYESLEFQAKVRERYLALKQILANETIIFIDATLPLNKVHLLIIKHLLDKLGLEV
jgi:dTMP kinase